MDKSKHFRPGLKKTSKESQKSNLSPIERDTVQEIITPAATKMNQIEIKMLLIDEYVQSGQLIYLVAVLNAIEHIDKTLLKCLDRQIKVSHDRRLVTIGLFNIAKVNVNIDIKSESKFNGLANLYEFLHYGRRTILTHNYNGYNFFNELVKTLTSIAIDIDSKIILTDNAFPEKDIDLVSLAYSIEWLSKIKKHRNNNIIFGIDSPFGDYNVSPIGHHNALSLLGGLKENKELSEYYFTVKTVNFENIESKLKFLLDGKSVDVYIHDQNWINDFNNRKIKLTKGERLKAKFRLVISPLTKKVVAFLFIKIYYRSET